MSQQEEMKMDVHQVIKHYGGKCEAAVALNRTTQSIDHWLRAHEQGKPIPQAAQRSIQSLTRGKLKIDEQVKNDKS